jgi:hypothetical protein
MYNLIKVKQIDGAGLSGVFYEALNSEYATGVISDLIFSNAIFKTGNQTISGGKNFDIRPTVRYTGVLISGDNAGSVSFNYFPYGERNVNDALKRLYDIVLYTPPRMVITTQAYRYLNEESNIIPGFNGTVEKGTTVFPFRINWTLATGTITGQRFIELPSYNDQMRSGIREILYASPITESATFTLQYGDVKTPIVTTPTTISFLNKRYWGATVSETLDNNALLGLEYSEFASNRFQERYFYPGGGYIYLAWPQSFGPATFRVNGLSSSSWILNVLSFTNTKGFTENYNVYRSQYKQFGINIRVEAL